MSQKRLAKVALIKYRINFRNYGIPTKVVPPNTTLHAIKLFCCIIYIYRGIYIMIVLVEHIIHYACKKKLRLQHTTLQQIVELKTVEHICYDNAYTEELL